MSAAGWRRYLRPIWPNWRAEVDDELRHHLDLTVERLVGEGLSPAAARAEAERRFGAVAPVRDACLAIDRRRRRRLALADQATSFAQDFRFGLRMLRRSPGFSLLALLCLILAIGANAAVYSWIEGILLRPYPLVAEQDRLFALAGTERGTPGHTALSWPDFVDLQRGSTLVQSFIANNITSTTLSVGERAALIPGGIVSANYFDAIGVRPLLGRGFEPGEDIGRNAHPVVVIGYRLWQERFNGDRNVLGKALVMNGAPHTIIGVTPEGFAGTFVGYVFEFWVPASQDEVFDPTGYKQDDRAARWIEPMVRLKPGVTRDQAQAELSALTGQLERQYPAADRGRGVMLVPLWKNPFNGASLLFPALRTALVVAVFVLLIACANVGNLLLARAFGRRREMMVRLALGAGRGRLVRQLLAEALALSAAATLGGLLVAYWCRHALVLFFPTRAGITFNFPGSVDWRVVVACGAVCLVATLLFALVPALQTSNIDLAAEIKAESMVGGRAKGWVRSGLVLVQVSLSFVLLVGAGLLLKSLQGIRRADPGFSTNGVLLTSINLTAAGYDTTRGRVFQDALLDRLRSQGTIASAAYARIPPFSLKPYSSAPIAVDGYEVPSDQQPTAEYDEIGPGFLATIGIPVVSGREFMRDDDTASTPVAVVNETMAARYWRGTNPVGSRLQVKGRWMQVVGVVRDARYASLQEPQKPFFYVPLRQHFSGFVVLHLRTPASPESLGPALTREIHALDPELSAGELISMRTQVDRTMSPQRAAVALLEVFAGIALLLAAVGLYGVLSYVVSQATRELGLRMALGAGASRLVRLVMTRGLILAGVGVIVGVAAAVGVTRLLGDLLYRVSPRDPMVFGSALLVMLTASVAACLVPAWRATRVDPVQALRLE